MLKRKSAKISFRSLFLIMSLLSLERNFVKDRKASMTIYFNAETCVLILVISLYLNQLNSKQPYRALLSYDRLSVLKEIHFASHSSSIQGYHR